MKYLIPIFAMKLGLETPAHAAPVQRVTSLGAIPLAQAMSTLDDLGAWPLPSGGALRLMQVMSRPGGECGVSDLPDADTCPRFTLFVSLNGETAVPVDFALFRLPETLGWQVPRDARLGRDGDNYTLALAACETKPVAKGAEWKGTSYTLSIAHHLSSQGTFLFDVTLEKLPDERPDCAPLK